MEFIEQNPLVMNGKPVIKGTRLTVDYIISLLAQGLSTDDILKEYKGLKKEEILACLHFAESILNKTAIFEFENSAS